MSLKERVTKAYEESREDVYRYLLAFGLPPASAQDATQEVFLRLFSTLERGEAIENLRAWTFRVAHNLALKMVSRTKPMQTLDPLMEAQLADGAPSAERWLLDAERQTRLSEAIEALSPQQRLCLHLRSEGLRYREIAETVGISVSSVSEFLCRALTNLRKAVS